MRRIPSARALLTLVSVAALALFAPPAATASQNRAAGAQTMDAPADFDSAVSVSPRVHIRTYNTGNRCLNARGGSSANSTPVILFDCTADWNELWQLYRPPGTNYYYIFLTAPDGRHRCLNAYFNGVDNFTPIVIYDCVTSWNNVWNIDDGSVVDGIFYIKTVNNSVNRCVNARGGGTANLTEIILYDCVGTRNNMWM